MTAVLPWDRFSPDPESELPYRAPSAPAPQPTPPPGALVPSPVPVGTDEIDWGELVADAVKEAMAEALPAVKKEAADYVKSAVRADRGKVDVLHPTVTAVTSTGRELVVADAKSRSWRTFWQGLAIDVVYALIALAGALTSIDPLDKVSWVVLGALVIKTLIQTVISYVMRIRITPTMKTDSGQKVDILPVPAVPDPDAGRHTRLPGLGRHAKKD